MAPVHRWISGSAKNIRKHSMFLLCSRQHLCGAQNMKVAPSRSCCCAHGAFLGVTLEPVSPVLHSGSPPPPAWMETGEPSRYLNFRRAVSFACHWTSLPPVARFVRGPDRTLRWNHAPVLRFSSMSRLVLGDQPPGALLALRTAVACPSTNLEKGCSRQQLSSSTLRSRFVWAIHSRSVFVRAPPTGWPV